MTSNNNYAFVTGSSSGLGKAIAIALAREGYNLIIHYHDSRQEAIETVEEIEALGRKVILVQGDLTDSTLVNAIFDDLKARQIKLDIFIQNVGNYLKKNIVEVSFEEWNEIINSNLNLTFYCNKRATELMLPHRYGRIINIGFASLGNTTAKPLITPYYIAKNGILLLTKSLGATLAKDNITVNMVSPGVLESSVSKPIEEIPMGRLGKLEEVVRAVLFLIKQESEYITGVNIDISGGWRL